MPKAKKKKVVIISKFLSAEETAKLMKVSKKRFKELEKMMEKIFNQKEKK